MKVRLEQIVAKRSAQALATGAGFCAVFFALNWRLFAFGSDAQLFLHGDNLSALNNLYYLLEQFNPFKPFDTFIGLHGMLGSYPMSEPQNSIFFPPLFAAFVLYRLLGFGPTGLYYLLLGIHALHLLCGVTVVYALIRRFLHLDRTLAFAGGLVYMGLGWNAGWLGTNTLSFMTGLVPVVAYALLAYLERPSRSRFAAYVAALALFLLGGGLVNYFFYVWLNIGVLLLAKALVRHRSGQRRDASRMVDIKQAGLLLVAGPAWSLGIYAVQLMASARVVPDITHAATGYEALATFGAQFSDLVGLVIPKFGLIGFGTTVNPRSISRFSTANLLYIGVLPLLLALAGLLVVRSRRVLFLAAAATLNLLLSFGGLFVLWDLTLLFPGNGQFRGHYKYLTMVGLYLALLCPLVLQRFREGWYSPAAFRRFILAGAFALAVLALGGIGAGVGALAARESTNALTPHVDILTTATNSIIRTVLMLLLILVVLTVWTKRGGKPMLWCLLLLLVLDTSVNYAYAPYLKTPVADLTSRHFFRCCQGKSVVLRLDGFSQAYLIPEVVGVDVFRSYTAIPNKYLVDYEAKLFTEIGTPQLQFLNGVVDGILTTTRLEGEGLRLVLTERITQDNASKFYRYNPNGHIHEGWGAARDLIGADVYYYELRPRKSFVAPRFAVAKDSAEALGLIGRATDPSAAVVIGGPPSTASASAAALGDVEVVARTATSSRLRMSSTAGSVLVTDIPYSGIWKATIAGRQVPVVRVNHAFVGVRMGAQKDVEVEVVVDRTPMRAALAVSGLSIIGLAAFVASGRLRRLRDRAGSREPNG